MRKLPQYHNIDDVTSMDDGRFVVKLPSSADKPVFYPKPVARISSE